LPPPPTKRFCTSGTYGLSGGLTGDRLCLFSSTHRGREKPRLAAFHTFLINELKPGPAPPRIIKPVTPSDAELVQQALAGSQAAYHALVSRYAAPAVNFAARMVQDPALAEDLAQEAFVRAFAHLANYDPQRRFLSWFFQILHNLTIDYLRRKRPATVSLDAMEEAGHPVFAASPPAAWPDARAEQLALSRALDAALARVRPEYREAVVLHYREELSIEEVAAAMGMPTGTVKTYLHRARKELAAILEGQGWAAAPSAKTETSGGEIP
jgi:RNA polymerase sigma-70 factor (ECF subfamily)